MNQVDRHTRFAPATGASPRAAQDAFLRWSEGREGRHELVRGNVVMMTGASVRHAMLAARIMVGLFRQIDPDRFHAVTSDLGVRTPAGVRYPDVVVDTLPEDGAALAADNPVLLAEVLSPSSIAIDMVEKAAEYTALPSLRIYAVFSQDEPRAWIWQRDEQGAFPGSPAMLAGADAVLAIPSLDVALPLGELYRGIGA
jgi:Uma2 family endonuclease